MAKKLKTTLQGLPTIPNVLQTSSLQMDNGDITLPESVIGSSKINTLASSSGNSSKRFNEQDLLM